MLVQKTWHSGVVEGYTCGRYDVRVGEKLKRLQRGDLVLQSRASAYEAPPPPQLAPAASEERQMDSDDSEDTALSKLALKKRDADKRTAASSSGAAAAGPRAPVPVAVAVGGATAKAGSAEEEADEAMEQHKAGADDTDDEMPLSFMAQQLQPPPSMLKKTAATAAQADKLNPAEPSGPRPRPRAAPASWRASARHETSANVGAEAPRVEVVARPAKAARTPWSHHWARGGVRI